MKQFSAPQKQKKNAARGIIMQSIQGAGQARAPTGDVRRASSDGEHGLQTSNSVQANLLRDESHHQTQKNQS